MLSYFDRVPMSFRPVLEAARTRLPKTVNEMITPRFLCGISPRFVGLHYQDMAQNFPDIAAAGFTYDNCAHACYALATPDERPTVVFPELEIYSDVVGTVLHEIGHLFDEATEFHLQVPETTWYSQTNRAEAFAEAFKLILMPPTAKWDDYVHSEAMRPLRMAMGA